MDDRDWLHIRCGGCQKYLGRVPLTTGSPGVRRVPAPSPITTRGALILCPRCHSYNDVTLPRRNETR